MLPHLGSQEAVRLVSGANKNVGQQRHHCVVVLDEECLGSLKGSRRRVLLVQYM
jgi:hypothetical protein